jgi:membrane dipeptidase
MARGSAAGSSSSSLKHARTLLARHILIDGHNDLPWAIRTAEHKPGDLAAHDLRRRLPGHTDLPRLRRGGVGGQFWSVYVPTSAAAVGEAGAARTQLEQIDLARRMIARYPRDMTLCWSAREVRSAFAGGRIASLLGMEGGHVLENSLGALRAYRELGARYVTLTHNRNTDWADSATDEPRHGGLTDFGREVVAEMNRMGMLVDLSHTAPSTMADALDASVAPVIFSHSSARAVCDHPRNVPDDILRRVPENGGVVMVTFVAAFVSGQASAVLSKAMAEVDRRSEAVADPDQRRHIRDAVYGSIDVRLPSVADVADHVEHVVEMAGVEHVGIGGDFDGTSHLPRGLSDVSGYPNLFAELIERGWNDRDLARLAGTNVLRVMSETEAAASRLSTTTRRASPG